MNDGLVTRRSAHDVGETISALRAEAERVGAAVAAVVDHAAAVRKAGLARRYGLGEDQRAPLNAPTKIASAVDGR